ncbi:MAG: VOC family protein [Alphaproteobacteria bacterium]|nr:VOC family protein [Alphaproteobacteria bacterium]
MKINSYYPVLCVQDIELNHVFYQQYFGFSTVFQNEWYVHLTNTQQPEVNLALLDYRHASLPHNYRKTVQGVLLNFELDAVDDMYNHLKQQGLSILLHLRDEPWGQRHFIVQGPEGIMIDIIKIIEPTAAFLMQ